MRNLKIIILLFLISVVTSAQPARAGILIDVACLAERGVVATAKFALKTTWKTTVYVSKQTTKGVKFVAKKTKNAASNKLNAASFNEKKLPSLEKMPSKNNYGEYNSNNDNELLETLPKLPKIEDLQE